MNEPTPDRAGKGQRRPSGPAGQGGGSRPYGKGASRPGAGGAGGKSSAGSRGGKSFGGSDPRGEKKPYGKSGDARGDRPYSRPGENAAEKKPYGRSADSRGDRPNSRPDDSRGDRYSKPNDSRGGSDRPYNKDSRGSDRPFSSRPTESRGGDRPYKKADDSRGDRYSKPSDSRTDRYSKPDDSRTDRYSKPSDSRGGDRPYSSRPTESRGGGDRPYNKDSRGSDRPYNSRPSDSRGGGDRPYSSRPTESRGGSDRPYTKDSRGSDRPYNSRPTDSRGGDRPYRRDDRPREAPRPGLAPKANEPETPKGLDLRQLPRGVRAELRGLTSELAEVVGAHLLMAGRLIDTDPELAYAHAEAARRRAARLPITREAAAETAYAAGDFRTALTEFRALRRMSGGNEYLPAMADCERALGHHQAAIKLIKEGLASGPEAPAQIELRLVEAGIRVDTGHVDEAMRLLRSEIENIGTRGTKLSRARLRYAYADLLERTGEGDQAEMWFDAVVRLDPEQETDAADRAAALRGLIIDYDDSDDEDESDDEESDEDESEDELDEDESDEVESDTGDDPPEGSEGIEVEDDEETDVE